MKTYTINIPCVISLMVQAEDRDALVEVATNIVDAIEDKEINVGGAPTFYIVTNGVKHMEVDDEQDV